MTITYAPWNTIEDIFDDQLPAFKESVDLTIQMRSLSGWNDVDTLVDRINVRSNWQVIAHTVHYDTLTLYLVRDLKVNSYIPWR